MAKRRRKRINYSSTSKSKLIEIETYEQMRAKFSDDLVNAFIKISEAGWENSKLYEQYKAVAEKYLGSNRIQDPIEQTRLIVQLSKATADIVRKASNTRCDKHRSYRAIRKPKVNCKVCWGIYNAKRKAKKEKEEAEKST
jgi:hypothetical protein